MGRVVCFGSRPALVSNLIIEAIRERYNQHGLIDLEEERAEDLHPGDRVLVNTRYFDGVRAIFKERRGSDRVIVLLSMMGADRFLELSVNNVAKVS